MNTLITAAVAAKVLETVDAGLVSGAGNPVPGQMCVEAAVCYALGLPHGDDPQCVSRALRSLKIKLNDSNWSSDKARAKGLRRLAVAQLGSRDALDDREFAKRVAELAIRKQVPRALRAAASIQKDAGHKAKLLDAATKCEKKPTCQSALEARRAAVAAANDCYADAAYYAANAADAAATNAVKAADAAYYANAVADAAAGIADAAAGIADAVAAVVVAARYAVGAAVGAAAAAAAAAAANAVADADAAYAQDKTLADFAEDVVQILIEMKAPGCEWLPLTERR